jgi:lysyl-tRNA synthetase class 2
VADAYSEIIKAREEKLARLKKRGIDPYPASCLRTHTILEARNLYAKKTDLPQKLILAGRLRAIRRQGGLIFADLRDATEKIQLLFKRDVLGSSNFEDLDLLDIGDFLEAEGGLITTKKGELTLLVKNWRILCKSLLPLPEKWHGLKDIEQRYRERELDLLMNKEVFNLFVKRAEIIQNLRKFLIDHGFLEVETPILQNIPGGTNARPFITHYNAYNTDVYLRIAPELYLKRLLVGGFEKVFEFAVCFRNEGVDAVHNPEFIDLEFYAAYWDEEKLMDFTEDLLINVTEKSLGKAAIFRDNKEIPLKKPFLRKEFVEITKGKESDEALKEAVKKIEEPTFILHHPTKMIPLAKRSEKPEYVRSFQLVIGGVELVKAFSELNDPKDQRERFLEQERLRAAGDEEAQRLDEAFLRALSYGMPPAAGFGMGVERLLILLLNKNSIREVLLFPYMRPKEDVGY